jgi:serine/threonine-protein kinase
VHCVRCKAAIEKSFRACPHCGEPVTEFLRRYSEEPVDGKYRILERLGAGGMGDVYKVEHTYLGAIRVIKVIRAQISENRDAHDRFLREARVATKVQHPNAATLHDFSALPDGSHYMVWEYIDGENIAQRLKARRVLPPREAARIAIDALRGLDAIHRAGIVHRDISPENIMLTRDGAVKVIDLGVAKTEEPNDNATRAGVFVGKLRYASPEHLGILEEGERIDGRADLYSLAMVLFEMLTGRPPFEATSPHEYILMHSRDTHFKSIELPAQLPGGAELQGVLQRALERDRTKRFATAAEFANALEAIEQILPDPAAMKTMHVATDADETMRVTPAPVSTTSTSTRPDTLHRETVRTAAPAAPAPQTVVTREKNSYAMAIIIALVVLVIGLGGALAVMLTGRDREPEPAPAAVVELTRTMPPTETTIEVVSPPATTTTATAAPALSAPMPAPTTTASTAARTASAAPQPRPVTPAPAAVTPAVTTREEPSPSTPPSTSNVPAFIAGGRGNEDAHDALIEALRGQLAGIRRVRVTGSRAQDLVAAMREEVPFVTVADDSPVTIHFDGSVDRSARGRKQRYGEATISKNGRPIFRWQLPPEEFRVGHTPAEALAGLLAGAFEEE